MIKGMRGISRGGYKIVHGLDSSDIPCVIVDDRVPARMWLSCSVNEGAACLFLCADKEKLLRHRPGKPEIIDLPTMEIP
jgi:hypothetical protein